MTKMTNPPNTDQTQPAEEYPQEQGGATPNQNDVPVLTLIEKQQELFHLATARQREARRRLNMLGDFVRADFNKKEMRAFAQERYLLEKTLTAWKHDYLHDGFDGLLPKDWTHLKKKSQQVVVERLQALDTLTEALTISAEDIANLAKKHGWSLRKAERTVRRYQVDGVWGLAPERDPERLHRPKQHNPPIEFAAATPEARATAEKRKTLIDSYIGKRPIPNKELKTYAEQHGCSLRTMRDYLYKFEKWGLPGLLPKEERSDKGHPHNMSPLMIDIIVALRFSQMDIPLHEIHKRAKQRALLLGEPEPTLWQVRSICDHIPKEEKLIADKRFGKFRNERRITYRFQFDGRVIVYQIDFTPVDVLVRDIRKRGYRTRSEETRPYLITCIECSSRLILGKLLTYDVPDSNDIALVIQQALVVTEEKPYGGIPHAIWVDQGAQLISHHVQRIAADLHFELKIGKPNHPEDRGDPQKRGREERFFGTLNTRLWSTLPGYVHSNTVERNPSAKAELTISELAKKLEAFIVEYHHTEHSETKMTPLAFWASKCHANGVSSRNLDLLLKKVDRVVNKDHIHYGTRSYWHDDLAEVEIGTHVDVYAQPDYMRPDEIQVYYNGHHLCTAFAHDSVKGRAVDGKRVLAAQRRQTKRITNSINRKKAVLRRADRQIETQGLPHPEPEQEREPHSSPEKKEAPSAPPTSPSQKDTRFKSNGASWDVLLKAKERQQKS